MINLQQNAIKILIVLLVLVLLGVVVTSLSKSDFELRAFLAGLTTEKDIEEKEEAGIKVSEGFLEKMRQDMRIAQNGEREEGKDAEHSVPQYQEAVSQGKVYNEVAESGDGVTHLARRAVSKYLSETNRNDITPEHRIFIEDYIQKRIGNHWLSPGEVVVISENLVAEAINKSLELNPDQLNNLKQFSVMVSF